MKTPRLERALAALRMRPDLIVIGASAGGIDALSAVLPAISPRSAPAAVVLHLSPDRPSLLPGLFRARCAVPVLEVDDKLRLDDGAIYFATPDYHFLVDSDRCCVLSMDEPVLFSRPSIDVLFESAADVLGPRMLGVLMTGANSDGASGIAAIRAAGGVVVVQDPTEAAVDTMPRAALERCPSAHALSLNEIAALFAAASEMPLRRAP